MGTARGTALLLCRAPSAAGRERLGRSTEGCGLVSAASSLVGAEVHGTTSSALLCRGAALNPRAALAVPWGEGQLER